MVREQDLLPSRQNDRLRPDPRLASDACHMREVGAPLPAVQTVLPKLSDLDPLYAQSLQFDHFQETQTAKPKLSGC